MLHEERDVDGPCIREELLRRLYGLEVRRSGNARFSAGWKNPKMDAAHSSPIYWAPYPGIEPLLAATLFRYLTEIRPAVMSQRRAAGLGDHPYLLVCTRPTIVDGRVEIGQPYTVAAMNSSWVGAIGRLSRRTGTELRVSKHNGTTIHALRHLYGNTLKRCGFDEPTIQDLMHHKSILSSRAYTRSDVEEANEQLEAARDLLRAGRIKDVYIQFPPVGNLIDKHFRPSGPWSRTR